jgi:hypothetical protein
MEIQQSPPDYFHSRVFSSHSRSPIVKGNRKELEWKRMACDLANGHDFLILNGVRYAAPFAPHFLLSASPAYRYSPSS